MQLSLTFVGSRPKSGGIDEVTGLYLKRIAHYAEIEMKAFADEEALFAFVGRLHARTPACLAMLDSRGEQWSSEAFANWLGARQNAGQQRIVFAIGPASGWSPTALRRAQVQLSLSKMTLPHELARLVLAEQLYRAFTILAGHPYHLGH
jgi:23S rRNA (pseudouridine1915-N3)-methyltransferase